MPPGTTKEPSHRVHSFGSPTRHNKRDQACQSFCADFPSGTAREGQIISPSTVISHLSRQCDQTTEVFATRHRGLLMEPAGGHKPISGGLSMCVAVVLFQTTSPRAIHTMRTPPRCHDQGILVWSAPYTGQFLFEPCFYFGQCLFWPNFTWATFHVGQQSGPRGGWRVFQKKVWAVWVVGPGWAQLRVGSRQGGGGASWEPQISRFCCLFPPNMSMMFSSLGVFSWNCGGVSRPRSTQNPRGFTRALLRSFSEEPLGLAQDGAREAQTRILGGS